MTETYDDIIHLPHHVSKRHPQMSLYNRAAQFAPFAALTGYEEAIIETARLTAPKVDMMEDNQQLLDRKLALLSHSLREQPTVSITYFQPDKKKSGGQYLTFTGQFGVFKLLFPLYLFIVSKHVKLYRLSSLLF